MERPYAKLKGEELHRQLKRSDLALAAELDRLQLTDERFRSILRTNLDLQAEVDSRKNNQTQT